VHNLHTQVQAREAEQEQGTAHFCLPDSISLDFISRPSMCAIDLVLYQCGCMVSASDLHAREALSRGCLAFHCVKVSSDHCLRADLAIHNGVDLGPCKLGLDDSKARKIRLERWHRRAEMMENDHEDDQDNIKYLGLEELFAEVASVGVSVEDQERWKIESHLDMLVDSMIQYLQEKGTQMTALLIESANRDVLFLVATICIKYQQMQIVASTSA
jgi:hypothetical protein